MQHLTLLNTPCVGHTVTLDSRAQLTAGLVDIMHLLLVSGDVNLLNVMPTSQFTPQTQRRVGQCDLSRRQSARLLNSLNNLSFTGWVKNVSC